MMSKFTLSRATILIVMQTNPIIWESEYWKVIIHEDQQYLGRAIVSAKNRERPTLASLTSEEWLDFQNVVNDFEQALRSAFGAELFNWSCLMNVAFQNDPPDPHVHWHVRPRYRQPVVFAGLQFHDEDFGKHYGTTTRELSSDVLQVVANEIKNHRNHRDI
jgi:diadenosine tetraphosphate (Ap4A) HIT family hydrolase